MSSPFDSEILSRKRGINVKKMDYLPYWYEFPLLIMNNYSEFQVNIFSNNRAIRLHLENSKSKKGHTFVQRNW